MCWGRHGRDRMVVVFTTTYAISAEVDEVYSIQHYVIKVCQWLAIGKWFSSGSPVSSTNKTDRHDITEILLKVALNIINQTNQLYIQLVQLIGQTSN